ncbi:hypothetical protein ANTQUA_LOCUS2061 [Anthophora quadrimaculata]
MFQYNNNILISQELLYVVVKQRGISVLIVHWNDTLKFYNDKNQIVFKSPVLRYKRAQRGTFILLCNLQDNM